MKKNSTLKRLAWFAGLWVAGVLCLMLLAGIIRWSIPQI